MTVPGERGPTGDHGQDGQTGPVGHAGERGKTGPAGGAGVRGRRGGLGGPQSLVVFVFVVLVFGTLSLYVEVQRRDTDHRLHAQCLIAAGNAESLNTLIDVVLDRLAEQPQSTERDEGIALYTAAKPRAPDCG